jgi:hypothetical protein
MKINKKTLLNMDKKLKIHFKMSKKNKSFIHLIIKKKRRNYIYQRSKTINYNCNNFYLLIIEFKLNLIKNLFSLFVYE